MNLRIDRMKEMFRNLEVSVSAYNTAWVAMIPSYSIGSPLFPQSLNWVVENQHRDGSFDDLHNKHHCLLKSSLISTLACVLALKKWNFGDKYIEKGIYFIESKFEDANKDEEQQSPIGFDIIFPALLEYARDMNLNLPLSASHVHRMLDKRDLEFRRICHSNSRGEKAYLAYLAEGLGNLLGWEEVMKYQRKNGSLFNSPSATAAALINVQNTRCLEYLTSLLCRFQNADEVVKLPEYEQLFLLTSTCGRLLNDIQGFQRENSEGKLNNISLYMRDRGCASKEEAIKHMRSIIDESRQELLGLVVKKSGSEVP